MRIPTAILAIAMMANLALPATAGEKRTLALHFDHTGEDLMITYKDGDRYIPQALERLNTFLRDWRRNEPTEMDPKLFDLVWSVYRDVGATQPIHIVSAYRSPATNQMLRSKSNGVAENSQHIRGHAMDFFIPGISLSKLRAAAMKRQGGGVGYYPTSGSPFVHLDTGGIRAWPRMTRAQLLKLFPDGKTVHLPADGKALAGYDVALAELKRGKKPATEVAERPKGTTLVDILFGKPAATTPSPAPESVQIAAAALDSAEAAPLPVVRTSEPIVAAIEAPIPATRPAWMTKTNPDIQVIEGDYAVLGYAKVSQSLTGEDPFDFLLDLHDQAPEARETDTLSSFEHGGMLVADDILLSEANAYLEGAAFAKLSKPEQSDIRFLIQLPEALVPETFEPIGRTVTRRF